MLSVYLLEKRFYPTTVIKRFIVFKNEFRCVPNRKFFADIAANKPFGAVQAGFRLFFDTFVTNNGEEYAGQTQIIRYLYTGNRDKTNPRIVKSPGKDGADNFMNGFS